MPEALIKRQTTIEGIIKMAVDGVIVSTVKARYLKATAN